MKKILKQVIFKIYKTPILGKFFFAMISVLPSLKQKIIRFLTYNHFPDFYTYFYNKKVDISKQICDSYIKHIYIDISLLVCQKKLTGIPRVCLALIKNLKEIYKDNSTIQVTPVYSEEGKNFFVKALFENGYYTKQKKMNFASRVNFSRNDIIIFADLQMKNIITKKNYISSLIDKGITVYAILYDLIPIYFKEYFWEWKNFSREFELYLLTLSTLSGVITDSNSVLIEYKQWLQENSISVNPNFKMTYFHLGSDIQDSKSEGYTVTLKEDKRILEKIKSKKTFLSVSTIEPRKMHRQILGAFEILWKQELDINLVFVGNEGWLMDDFNEYMRLHKELNNHFFWLKGISDELLDSIYTESSAVIFASLAEGFGLAVTEGALHGNKLILRDIPVFRELAEDNALYFKTTESSELAETIKHFLELEEKNMTPDSSKIKVLTWRESTIMFLTNLGIEF